MMRSTSISRPMRGSKAPWAAREVRSRPYSVRKGSSFFCWACFAVPSHLDHLLAHGIKIETRRRQHAHGEAAVHPQEADEQVFGAHGGVIHALSLVGGVGQDLLGFLRKGQVGGGGDPLDEDALPFDFMAKVVRLDIEMFEELHDGIFALSQDAE